MLAGVSGASGSCTWARPLPQFPGWVPLFRPQLLWGKLSLGRILPSPTAEDRLRPLPLPPFSLGQKVARGVGLRVGPRAEERDGAVRSVKLGPLPEASNLIRPLAEATNPVASNSFVRAETRAVLCDLREVSVRFSSLPLFTLPPLTWAVSSKPWRPGRVQEQRKGGVELEGCGIGRVCYGPGLGH